MDGEREHDGVDREVRCAVKGGIKSNHFESTLATLQSQC